MQTFSAGGRFAGFRSKLICRAAAAVGIAAPAFPQATPAFQTPGMPTYGVQAQSGPDASQANRFSAGFNPAFSFIIDATADHTNNEDSPDGFDARLRVLELAANSWVDPNAWAYFVGAAEEEAVNVEEAAVHYLGFGGHRTLRAGRFFVDFGKQMQTHVHELRTLERPLVLRTYLGEEIKGDGIQWDDWTSVGDSTALRWSLGAFSSTLPEEAEDFDPDAAALQELTAPKKAKDFNYTARVTGFTDVGANGTLQLGVSARAIPRFALDYSPSVGTGFATEDLENYVFGADVTYGWVGDTGEERWTIGVEALDNTGDNGSELSDPDATPGSGDEILNVFDEDVFGFLAWTDYQWDRFNSVGLEFSAAQLADASQSDESEIEAYYTRKLSEFQRIRIVVSSFESDVNEDSMRVAIQYTAVLGAHGHGINW